MLGEAPQRATRRALRKALREVAFGPRRVVARVQPKEGPDRPLPWGPFRVPKEGAEPKESDDPLPPASGVGRGSPKAVPPREGTEPRGLPRDSQKVSVGDLAERP